MAIPPNSTQFSQPMDPTDVLDYTITLSQGAADSSFLQVGESVASYTLTVTTEASAAGLTIKTGGGYSTTLTGNVIKFWLSISAGLQSSTTFDGVGLSLAIELTVTTNASPARIKQRTYVVKVANQ